MNIKYYSVYDSCYRGNVGISLGGFPKGSFIFKTTNKKLAERIVEIMKPISEREGQFSPTIFEEIFSVGEYDKNISEMTDKQIIEWMKEKK